MKIIIVEDDPNKSHHIKQALLDWSNGCEIAEARSYRSALQAIIGETADLIIMDMTLPTYDVTEAEPGGRTRVFGGRDLMAEMKRRGLQIPTVVVTQFESFGEGERRQTLEELADGLRASFPTFLGVVYYHPARTDWREHLGAALSRVKG